MAESKGIPWKGKAAQQGGSLAATDPNYRPASPKAAAPTPAPAEGEAAPAAPAAAVPAAPAAPVAPAAAPGAAGGKGIPWKGKAAQQGGSAARQAQAPAAAPAAPVAAVPARAAAAPTAPVRPVGPPPVVEVLRGLVPDLKLEMRHSYAEVTIPAEHLLAAARLARSEFGYDYLSAVTGVDWQDRFEVLYHCYSFDYQRTSSCLVLRVPLPHDAAPLIPSVTGVWPGADYQEREIYDLLGIRFSGHPDLRRILLADDFPGHPLRKDYQTDYGYVVVHHLRAGAEGQAEVQYVPPHVANAFGPRGE